MKHLKDFISSVTACVVLPSEPLIFLLEPGALSFLSSSDESPSRCLCRRPARPLLARLKELGERLVGRSVGPTLVEKLFPRSFVRSLAPSLFLSVGRHRHATQFYPLRRLAAAARLLFSAASKEISIRARCQIRPSAMFLFHSHGSNEILRCAVVLISTYHSTTLSDHSWPLQPIPEMLTPCCLPDLITDISSTPSILRRAASKSHLVIPLE